MVQREGRGGECDFSRRIWALKRYVARGRLCCRGMCPLKRNIFSNVVTENSGRLQLCAVEQRQPVRARGQQLHALHGFEVLR